VVTDRGTHKALVSELRVIVDSTPLSTANPRRMPQKLEVVLMRMLFPRDRGAGVVRMTGIAFDAGPSRNFA